MLLFLFDNDVFITTLRCDGCNHFVNIITVSTFFTERYFTSTVNFGWVMVLCMGKAETQMHCFRY